MAETLYEVYGYHEFESTWTVGVWRDRQSAGLVLAWLHAHKSREPARDFSPEDWENLTEADEEILEAERIRWDAWLKELTDKLPREHSADGYGLREFTINEPVNPADWALP